MNNIFKTETRHWKEKFNFYEKNNNAADTSSTVSKKHTIDDKKTRKITKSMIAFDMTYIFKLHKFSFIISIWNVGTHKLAYDSLSL